MYIDIVPLHTQILLCDGAEFSKCSFAAIIYSPDKISWERHLALTGNAELWKSYPYLLGIKQAELYHESLFAAL